MDKTTLRHLISVPGGFFENDLDAFVRSDDGNVEHYWTNGDVDDDRIFGPEDLGGRFDSDPIAVRRSEAGVEELHLIGRSGMELVDWSWRPQGGNRLLGEPTLRKLPAFSLADPEVIVAGSTIHVFAPSLDGPMRHWVLESMDDGWSGQEVLSEHPVDHDARPCATVREPGIIDVFAFASAGDGLLHWSREADGWHVEKRPGGRLQGRPTAASFAPGRLDVFAVDFDGVPVHWGWAGTSKFGPETKLGPVKLHGDDLSLMTMGDKQLTLVARLLTPDGFSSVVAWDLVPDIGEWQGPRDLAPSPFAAVARTVSSPDDEQVGKMRVLSRLADGSFSLDPFVFTSEDTIDGRPSWVEDADALAMRLVREEPAAPVGPFTPATTAPEVMARRAEDMVLLGVRWNQGVDVEAGPPPELVAGDGAELTVTLPPQHVREEVVRGKGDFQPAAVISGQPVWRSSLAGPSQIVVGLEAGARVPLSVEGVLAALRQSRVLPAENLTDPRTQIELPAGLLMTPFVAEEASVGLDHATGAVLGPDGSVGLWSSRVSAAGLAPAQPAGLNLRALGADSSNDGYPTSLRGGARARILVEEPTARIDQLRLSALGGDLTAAGAWPTFAWDHHATMGRDHKVRVATEGVIYPFGHRAVFVESSERFIVDSSEGAIGHLFKTSVLMITEPVKELTWSRAFPFTQVEIQRTIVDLGPQPAFKTKPFVSATVPSLDFPALDAILPLAFLQTLREVIPERGPGDPLVEDYAHRLVFDMTEAQNDAADGYLVSWLEHKRTRARDESLRAGARGDVDLYIVPGGVQSPVKFSVVLSSPSGPVHVDIPLVFVADIRLGEGHLHPAYRSLEDPDVLRDVAADFATAGGADVEIAPIRLDLVGSATPRPPDAPEVRRLHLVGELGEGGFVPRLGAAPAADEVSPPTERWAVEVAMTEVATLTGRAAADGPELLKMALSPELLSGAPDPGLLLVAPAGAAVTARFSNNSARSGGLAAPDLKIDGVSRSHGPVQADTFLAQVQEAGLTPEKFLGEDANLMGFDLVDLVDGSRVAEAPQILSDARPGQPPTVTMLWSEVPLKSDHDMLETTDSSTLIVDVTLGPDGQQITCTVKDITLAFPERADDVKLLEVHFDEVRLTQQGGGAPALRVSGVSIEFFRSLKLLETLQKAVKMDGPAIHVSERGVTATYDLPVPDVATGGFQLTGLTFHGMIDVPFDQRPVSIELAFASREDPFNVSVLAIGGGGYVDIALDSTDLKRLEIALEFGASIEIDFVVASGEVHVMGGIRVADDDGDFRLAGYVRFGGMVEVLGLISVSVELVATLEYFDRLEDPALDTGVVVNAMVGRATLVLEVDLLLVSESVELDTGPWVISGDNATPVMDRGVAPVLLDPDAWRSYRDAFDEAALS